METTPSEQNINTEQVTDNIPKLSTTNNPLDELVSISSVNVVNKFLSCCAKCCIPICCCCSDEFKYETSSINGKRIFMTEGKLSCKIGSNAKISNFDHCKSYSLLSSQQKSSYKEQTLFCEIHKEYKCSCCGTSELKLKVVIPSENNKLVGIIKFENECCQTEEGGDLECCGINCSELVECCKGEECCYEHDKCCTIYNHEKKLEYIIYLKKCGIVLFNCCGDRELIIKNNKKKKVGKIKISKISGICDTKYKFNITFPETTKELKLTIINAVIAIDMAIL